MCVCEENKRREETDVEQTDGTNVLIPASEARSFLRLETTCKTGREVAGHDQDESSSRSIVSLRKVLNDVCTAKDG
jgi:hypothetical protein